MNDNILLFFSKKKRGEDNILQYAHILTLLCKIMHIKNELPEEILFHNIFCYSLKIIAKIPTTFTNNIYIYIYILMQRLKLFNFKIQYEIVVSYATTLIKFRTK